eukprot:scaffold886_cov317-Prasinococcus_capsulatus_cf.AAC.19
MPGAGARPARAAPIATHSSAPWPTSRPDDDNDDDDGPGAPVAPAGRAEELGSDGGDGHGEDASVHRRLSRPAARRSR